MEKNGSSSVEEGLDLQWIFRSCLDVESYPVEHNSSVEAESSSICVGDGGRKSIGLSTGEEAAGNQNESVQFVLEIEHEGNDSAQRTMISTETVAQPWPKGKRLPQGT